MLVVMLNFLTEVKCSPKERHECINGLQYAHVVVSVANLFVPQYIF
jgi:hypothetical protein